MIKAFLKLAAAVLFAACAAAAPAHADLKDIIASGKIRIGVPNDVPPFGFVDKNNQLAGLDIDVAHMVAKALGVKLEMTQITGANRVPFLVTNKIDLVIAAMGATPQRALQVDFSSPYAALSIGVFGPASIDVSNASQLGNHTIGVARGTTQDIELTAMAPKADIIRYDDDATAAAAYLSGQVDLLATADVVANDLSKKHPDKKLGAKFIIRFSPCHIGLREGNPELLQWLNTFVFYNRMNGKLNDLSKKWLGTAFPKTMPSL